MTRIRQPKFIVLDTNVFIADYWLRSPSFLLLREFLNAAKATLVVPKIVFEEVVNHHQEDLSNLRLGVRANVREAGRLFRNVRSPGNWLIDIARSVSSDPYEKFLSAELTKLKAQIPDYADIPHSDVVRRDLKRRKPFQQSGKGYRDTLLWETVIRDCVAANALTVLVTQNKHDFYGAGDVLHEELLKDVSCAANGEDAEVFVARDLPAFTDTYVVPYLTDRKDFALLVQHKKVSGLDLNEVCERNMDALVAAANESPSAMVDDVSYEPEVDTIDLSGEFQVEQASEVSKHVLLVAFEIQAFVSFTYFIPHSEYYTLAPEQMRSIAVLDANWNESVMQAESSTLITVKCRLTFNTKTKNVELFEVESIENAA